MHIGTRQTSPTMFQIVIFFVWYRNNETSCKIKNIINFSESLNSYKFLMFDTETHQKSTKITKKQQKTTSTSPFCLGWAAQYLDRDQLQPGQVGSGWNGDGTWMGRGLHRERYDLVGGLEHVLFFHIWGIIIPVDQLIFFRLKPPTSYQWPFKVDFCLWKWQCIECIVDLPSGKWTSVWKINMFNGKTNYCHWA